MMVEMNLNDRRARRFSRSPFIDCPPCHGLGTLENVYCEECAGTGIEPISWSELFVEWRRQTQK